MSSFSNKKSIFSGQRGGGKPGLKASSGRMFGSVVNGSRGMAASSTGSGSGGSGGLRSTGLAGDQLEKKLHATLHKATRDRDNEHRQFVVATQRLSAAKGEVKNLQKNVAEERRKYASTRNELERTMIELETMEVSVDNLKRKFDFQHQDLIQKRNKIMKQKEDMQKASNEREKILNDSKSLLADQYRKNKTVSEKERLGYLNRLDRAILDFEDKTKLVDPDFEDVFKEGRHNVIVVGGNSDDISEGGLMYIENKKKERQQQTNDDLMFALMMMGKDEFILKLINEKTERLEDESKMIEVEIFRLKSLLATHGIDFDLDKINDEAGRVGQELSLDKIDDEAGRTGGELGGDVAGGNQSRVAKKTPEDPFDVDGDTPNMAGNEGAEDMKDTSMDHSHNHPHELDHHPSITASPSKGPKVDGDETMEEADNTTAVPAAEKDCSQTEVAVGEENSTNIPGGEAVDDRTD